MKKVNNFFWKNLSLSHKISLIGSLTLIGSLFLKWFSDVDVFRSGDQYSGINGPLYFVGINMLILASANIAMILMKSARWKISEKITQSGLGKYQMIAGFGVMYLMMIVNSVYFHPQFGLNILSKKSEMGVFVALMASVLMCVGGYMSYRKKFELMDAQDENNVENVVEQIRSESPIMDDNSHRPHAGGVGKDRVEQSIPSTVTVEQANYEQTPEQVNVEESTAQPTVNVDRNWNNKTDYERSKAYDNLKRMMMKDTMSADQRRKERAKQGKDNAFSANFGKNEKVIPAVQNKPIGGVDDMLRRGQLKSNASAEVTQDKGSAKPQMYRMDL